MTAIVVVKQPKQGLIHVAMDSAIYTADQNVKCFGVKFYPTPHWPGVVTALGNNATAVLFHWSLSQRFSSFDDFVERGESILLELMRSWGLPDGMALTPDGTHMIVAGFSSLRGPEAYAWRVDEYIPPGATAEQVSASGCYDQPWKLVKLPDVVMSPVADDQTAPAKYEGIDTAADPDEVRWSIRKVLEMQRHMKLPDGMGAIGGFAQFATVSAGGIHEGVLQRWSDDQTGAPLKPDPINWDRWHAENPKPAVSRLKREMLARKARKSGIQLVQS